MPSAAPRPHPVVALLRRAGAAAGAALSLALLTTVVYFPAPIPFLLPGLLALAVLSAWRIDLGLMAVALWVPVVRFTGRPWAPAAAWAEMLAVAVIAGWFCRRALARDHRRDDLDGPIAVAATVVIASLAVVTSLAQWRLTGALVSDVWLTTYRHAYFLMESSGDAVDTAMRLLEMLVLLRAAADVVGRQPSLVPRLAAALVAGAAAAAAINVWAVWSTASAAGGGIAGFVREFLTARVTVHYADPNAAGSYFVMMLPVAIGAAIGLASGARAWALAAGAAVVVAAGLWVSGSRTAMMAGLLAMLLPVAARVRTWRAPGSRGRYVAAAALLVLAAAATAYLLPHRGTQRSAGDALQVRYELSRTALRMLETAPVFGVGVGNFFNLSGQFVSQELLVLFPPALRENAHNYYLQLLAELGLAGFAAFTWLAWVAGRRLVRRPGDPPAGPLHWGMTIGLVAFALTCAGGHPILIDEPALTFALLAGVAAGWRADNVPDGSAAAIGDGLPAGRGWRPVVSPSAVVVALLLVLIPVRWYTGRAAMDLSNVAFGLTGWYTGRDGVAYRLAGRSSLIYIPAEYTAINLPLRATEPHGEVDLTIRVDGTIVERTRIRTGNWQVVRLPLPPHASRSRFRRLDLETGTVPLTPRMLFIGRITPVLNRSAIAPEIALEPQ